MRKIAALAFILLSCALFFLAAPGGSFSANRANVNVRVCVASGKDDISLSVKGPYTIEAIDSDIVLDKGIDLEMEHITPVNSGIQLGSAEFRIYGIRIIPKKDASIFIDGNRFRGVIDIIRTERMKLLVVNHLDIEKYLYGVLSHETPYYWPMQVLKAQAVAARTFVLHRKDLMRDRDYDVTSDVYSQVYGGHSGEKSRTRKAVDATKGEILTYDGKILPAYYHAICAGHTENAKAVFGVDLPPLKGVPCPYCRGARGFHWKASFSFRQIEERLNRYGIKANGINFICEGERDSSERLETVKIRDKEGMKEIEGYKFRLALDPNVIRSANFTTDVTPKGVIFKGDGWGHGVGMCQWGAFGMAKRRFNYKEILGYYYPGSRISAIRDRKKYEAGGI